MLHEADNQCEVKVMFEVKVCPSEVAVTVPVPLTPSGLIASSDMIVFVVIESSRQSCSTFNLLVLELRIFCVHFLSSDLKAVPLLSSSCVRQS